MNLPVRKPTRLKNFDYSTPGAYFVTVCVKNRVNLLGRIVGCGDFDAPKMELSEKGKILDKYITFMSKKYSHITIEKYVIMPNHFHAIIRIKSYKKTTSGLSQAPNPTNNEMSKFISLLKRYCNREYGKNIWQASCNDHIIRGEKDYQKIWEYIHYNHFKWKQDCFFNE